MNEKEAYEKELGYMRKRMEENLTSKPFGLAPLKREGESVWDEEVWGKEPPRTKPKYEYDYVERRIPTDLVDEAHEVLDKWLISKGINLEEL